MGTSVRRQLMMDKSTRFWSRIILVAMLFLAASSVASIESTLNTTTENTTLAPPTTTTTTPTTMTATPTTTTTSHTKVTTMATSTTTPTTTTSATTTTPTTVKSSALMPLETTMASTTTPTTTKSATTTTTVATSSALMTSKATIMSLTTSVTTTKATTTATSSALMPSFEATTPYVSSMNSTAVGNVIESTSRRPAAEGVMNNANVTLVYLLSSPPNCSEVLVNEVKTKLRNIVSTLNEKWRGLCSSSTCDNVNVIVNCKNERQIGVTIQLLGIPTTIRNDGGAEKSAEMLLNEVTFTSNTFQLAGLTLEKKNTTLTIIVTCAEGWSQSGQTCVKNTEGLMTVPIIIAIAAGVAGFVTIVSISIVFIVVCRRRRRARRALSYTGNEDHPYESLGTRTLSVVKDDPKSVIKDDPNPYDETASEVSNDGESEVYNTPEDVDDMEDCTIPGEPGHLSQQELRRAKKSSSRKSKTASGYAIPSMPLKLNHSETIESGIAEAKADHASGVEDYLTSTLSLKTKLRELQEGTLQVKENGFAEDVSMDASTVTSNTSDAKDYLTPTASLKTKVRALQAEWSLKMKQTPTEILESAEDSTSPASLEMTCYTKSVNSGLSASQPPLCSPKPASLSAAERSIANASKGPAPSAADDTCREIDKVLEDSEDEYLKPVVPNSKSVVVIKDVQGEKGRNHVPETPVSATPSLLSKIHAFEELAAQEKVHTHDRNSGGLHSAENEGSCSSTHSRASNLSDPGRRGRKDDHGGRRLDGARPTSPSEDSVKEEDRNLSASSVHRKVSHISRHRSPERDEINFVHAAENRGPESALPSSTSATSSHSSRHRSPPRETSPVHQGDKRKSEGHESIASTSSAHSRHHEPNTSKPATSTGTSPRNSDANKNESDSGMEDSTGDGRNSWLGTSSGSNWESAGHVPSSELSKSHRHKNNSTPPPPVAIKPRLVQLLEFSSSGTIPSPFHSEQSKSPALQPLSARSMPYLPAQSAVIDSPDMRQRSKAKLDTAKVEEFQHTIIPDSPPTGVLRGMRASIVDEEPAPDYPIYSLPPSLPPNRRP